MDTRQSVLNRRSAIAALVPHGHGDVWLGDCLESLLQQTRRLDAILVIDDASESPPVDIVRQFSRVTLLSSTERVGPVRLLQRVISDTGYDGYLFQDPDDWSGRDRLAVLLAEAERTGAELVGCQEVLIFHDTAEVRTSSYPLDVNRELRMRPDARELACHTSVVSRDLVLRSGFGKGLHVTTGGDFLWRAVEAGCVRNVPDYCYFRRTRESALNGAGWTGLGSPERWKLARMFRIRGVTPPGTAGRSEPTPLPLSAAATSITLAHITGPEPKGSSTERAEQSTGASSWSAMLTSHSLRASR